MESSHKLLIHAEDGSISIPSAPMSEVFYLMTSNVSRGRSLVWHGGLTGGYWELRMPKSHLRTILWLLGIPPLAPDVRAEDGASISASPSIRQTFYLAVSKVTQGRF